MLPRHNRVVQLLYYALVLLMFVLALVNTVYFYYAYVG